MSPFPHVRREPLPITDPEPEVDERRGLDGNGTMSAADLPINAHTFPRPSQLQVAEDLDLGADMPIRRTLCLVAEPGLFGRQCRDGYGHEGLHEWEVDRGSVLTAARVEALRDTPSDRLPVREALHRVLAEEAEERTDGDAEVALGPGDVDEDGRPAETILGRPVIGRWIA